MPENILPHECAKYLEKLDQTQYDIHRLKGLLTILNNQIFNLLEDFSFDKTISISDIENLFIFSDIISSFAEKADR